MTHDDALFRFRLRVFAVAEELGNVRAACRMFGVHPSTFYRWRGQVLRYGLEILRPRERRPPRMPNATPVFVEQRVIAFALGHPGFGPDRIAAELARPKWGGIRLSPNGVWRVLCRHGLNTRGKRLALVAGYAAVSEPVPAPIPERHIEAARPGEVVQMDCFYVGRLQGTKGAVWQYTAIDVASAYLWATLQPGSVKHPLSKHASGLARQVAADLARHGWQLETVTTDRGSEFVNSNFDDTLNDLGARHRLIVAGRPQSNGCVERVQQTTRDECWKPAFARHLIPGITGLREELRRYLHYYNHDRAHTGRNTKRGTPAVVLGAAKMWRR